MMKLFERRYDPIAAKEGTQRRISFYVIFIVASVIAVMCWKGNLEDIKNVYNTLLPFFGLVLGFWIGSSKGAADNREQLNKLIPPPSPGGVANKIDGGDYEANTAIQVSTPSNVTVTTEEQK